MNFAEGTVLTRFTIRVIIILEVLRYFFLELLQFIDFQNNGSLPASAKLAENTGQDDEIPATWQP